MPKKVCLILLISALDLIGADPIRNRPVRFTVVTKSGMAIELRLTEGDFEFGGPGRKQGH